MEFKVNKFDLVDIAKILGIYINEQLDWSYHISYHLIKKLNSICYGIRTVRKYMNESSLKILYFANFESVLKYGILFWGKDSMMQNIFVVQKRLIRIIKNMNYLESCRSVFRKMGVMTSYAVYIYECLMFFIRYKDLFGNKTNHGYETRTVDYNYIAHRLTLTEKSPLYMCVKLFNVLPNQIKQINTIKKFKMEIKKLLINLEPYCMKDFCQDL